MVRVKSLEITMNRILNRMLTIDYICILGLTKNTVNTIVYKLGRTLKDNNLIDNIKTDLNIQHNIHNDTFIIAN